MAQSLPPSTDAAVTSKRILVVEDNEDGAVTLGELLASLGHNVEICRDGYQALVKAREFRPDAVFCDIGLPGMTGYDVADALRREPELKSARLIALTGYASDDTERKASDAGFDARLLKPATLDDLRRVGGCVAPAAVQELKRRRGPKRR